MKSNIAPIDREFNAGARVFGWNYTTARSDVAQLFLTIAKKAIDFGVGSLVLMPRSTPISQRVDKVLQSPSSINKVTVDYNLGADLENYEQTTPLKTGSFKRIHDHIKSVPNPHQVLFLLFRDTLSKESVGELRQLYYSFAGVLHFATPIAIPDAYIDASFEFHNQGKLANGPNATGVMIKTIKHFNNAKPSPSYEMLETDAEGNWFSLTTRRPDEITLEEVLSTLYDLKTYELQRENHDKVRIMLDRYKQLTGQSRPKFMN